MNPFAKMFGAAQGSFLNSTLAAATKATEAFNMAKEEMVTQRDRASGSPIEAIIGYHTGLIGPGPAAPVRREAARRICGAVHSVAEALQVLTRHAWALMVVAGL